MTERTVPSLRETLLAAPRATLLAAPRATLLAAPRATLLAAPRATLLAAPLATLLAALLLLAGCGDPAAPQPPPTKAERAAAVPFAGREAKQVSSAFPEQRRDILEQAERTVLYTLNPERVQDGKLSPETERFHHYGILTQLEVTDVALQRKLVEAVYRGLKAEGAGPTECFKPRHALRFEMGGKSVDLLICFECTWVHLFADGSENSLRMLFSAGVKPVFDSAVKAP